MLLALVSVLLVCIISVQVGGALDTSSLINGVETIRSYGIGGTDGVPGPLETLNSAPIMLQFISAEDNSPKDVAMVSIYGSGRVVALGHDGFFINEAIDNADNRQFGNNIINWLNSGSYKRKVLVSVGHGEPWVGSGSYSSFYSGLSGYTVTTHTGPITSHALSDVSVLLISCARGSDFSSVEIDAIKNFVSNGGGLLIQGLGWSWSSTLDGYPMNKVAAPFGIRFLSGYLHHTFYVSQEPEPEPEPEPERSKVFIIWVGDRNSMNLHGAEVSIDGAPAGVTDQKGKVRTNVAYGSHWVYASSSCGSAGKIYNFNENIDGVALTIDSCDAGSTTCESTEITRIEFYTNDRLIASFTDQTLETVRVKKGDIVKVRAFGTYQGPDYAILSLTEGVSTHLVENVEPGEEGIACISFTADADMYISVVIHDHPDWEVEDVRYFTIDVVDEIQQQVIFEDNFDTENCGVITENYDDLANWNVINGTIDLIGSGTNLVDYPGWDPYPGNGLYLDLDGTYGKDISQGKAGTIKTKNEFLLQPGTYRLSFDLYLNPSESGNKVWVSIGNITEVEFRDPSLSDQEIDFEVSYPTAATIKFEHEGGDWRGLYLDNVKLVKIT